MPIKRQGDDDLAMIPVKMTMLGVIKAINGVIGRSAATKNFLRASYHRAQIFN